MTRPKLLSALVVPTLASCAEDGILSAGVDAQVRDLSDPPADLPSRDLAIKVANQGTALSDMGTYSVGGTTLDHLAITYQGGVERASAISLHDASRRLAPYFSPQIAYVDGHSFFRWRSLLGRSSSAQVWTPATGGSIEVLAAVPGVEATDASGHYVFLTDGVPPGETTVDLMVSPTDSAAWKTIAHQSPLSDDCIPQGVFAGEQLLALHCPYGDPHSNTSCFSTTPDKG